MKRINIEKFLSFLEGEIVRNYALEMEAVGKGNYSLAADIKTERLVYEFLRNTTTGENKTDLANFVEEVPDDYEDDLK